MFEITFPVDVPFSLSFSHPIFPPYKIVAEKKEAKKRKKKKGTIYFDSVSIKVEQVIGKILNEREKGERDK